MSIAREGWWVFLRAVLNRNLSITAVALCLFAAAIGAQAGDGFLTYDNRPLGSSDKPLILRTYFPDPGLGREVVAHHGLGHRARKYKPGKGDVAGFVDPIRGIPAAIGVNFGPGLSYCWDTTECRLLYAWQGGFLDMKNYWGTPESGRRKSFGYVPELAGPLIYLTRGSHPLGILDDFTAEAVPHFKAMRLVKGVPEFEYEIGAAKVRVRIVPGKKPMTFEKRYTISGVGRADYTESGYKFKLKRTRDAELKRIGDAEFTVVVKGRPDVLGGPAELPPDYKTDKANLDWGKALYTELGCFACHSTDGVRGHGPTFMNLYGGSRKIVGMKGTITADEAYLRESITKPGAKVVDGFPPGFMPVYPVEEKQIQSLILFLQTLNFE